MLYPILPVYLKTIGFSVFLIGILEGLAEAIAGISKGYFGKQSDLSGKRVPFVQLGYTLSALSKPMMAMFVFPVWIFLSRAIDRIGKGIRTGARDALLSDEAKPETKGSIFGFHRSMDTIGAVIGPSIALLYLYFYPQHYITLFYIAFIPGILAILASLFLQEHSDKKQNVPAKQNKSFFSFLSYWQESPAVYRKVVIGLLAFSLLNSSDVFLLLKVKQSGLSDSVVVGIYIFYNLVYALFAYQIGKLADFIGLKKMFITGIIIFTIVYLCMSFEWGLYATLLLFFLYGIYAAATEGISKAWISNITNNKDTATAIGTYTGFQTLCSLFASSFTGYIWYRYGAYYAFMITGFWTLLVVIYFLTIKMD
jgi:MFS family permease